ncbi:hypothetical protein V8F06_004152 [Rhypophila decipiens]
MVSTIPDLKPRVNATPRSKPWENITIPNNGPHIDRPPSPPAQPYSSSRTSTGGATPTILTRQLSSIALIILLYTAGMPFEPFGWTLGRLAGTYLFDRVFGGILLFCCFYFQYRIASLRASVIVSVPALVSPSSGSRIQNGRVVKDESTLSSTPVWVYRTSTYWHLAFSEGALLLLAEFGPSEILRRVIVVGIVSGLWLVGFAATPESYKRWAWGHIKAYLFFIILDEIRRVAFSAIGANSGGRRARQARW